MLKSLFLNFLFYNHPDSPIITCNETRAELGERDVKVQCRVKANPPLCWEGSKPLKWGRVVENIATDIALNMRDDQFYSSEVVVITSYVYSFCFNLYSFI